MRDGKLYIRPQELVQLILKFNIRQYIILAYIQFTRPTRNMHIRVFAEGEDEVTIVRTSAAVIYPSDALGRTLIFDVNICQLPVNYTFYYFLMQVNYYKCTCMHTKLMCSEYGYSIPGHVF